MGRMRRGGGRGASRGDTRQFRSAETHGDDASLTPTPQTAQPTSPGWHRVKLGAVSWRKLLLMSLE